MGWECLDENLLAEFAEGLLSAEDAAVVEQHLDECPDCAAVTAGLARLLGPTGPTREATPRGPTGRTERARPWSTRGDSIGRYVVFEWLGSGGMGEVYAADDPELGRRVALKLVHAGADEGNQQRLLREAQAMAKLAHPNVVAVHDVGMVEGRAFIAMELVKGVTLRAWLRQEQRSWQAILAVFIAAGRGLAAAHAAGIVHRDFKPDNVMIRDDGRVQVTDFGLARTGEPDEAGLVSTGELTANLVLSKTGAVLGTPAYMAPEQFRGDRAGPRSDQFAFCVALFQALYASHPFDTRSFHQLRASVLDGEIRALSAKRVPVGIRRALERGLEVDRERRFPSMELLLAALERVPRLRRRRWQGAAAAVGVVLLGGSMWLGGRQSSVPPMCLGGAEQVGKIWSPSRRHTVEAAFKASELPYAATAWADVAAALDDYAAAYAQTHRAACEATRVAGEQSDEVLGLRMACLQRRQDELGNLVELFTRADVGVVENSARAVRSLVGLDSCDAVRVLERRAPLPEDHGLRAELSAIERELARASALHMAGKLDQARPLLESLRERVAALDYPPLHAEILVALASARAEAGVDVSEEMVFAALTTATAAGNPRLAAGAALSYANLIASEKLRQPEAMRWISQAEATVAEIGGDPLLAATIAEARGNLAHLAGEHGAAVEHFRSALAMRKQLADSGEAALAEAEARVAKALFSAGKYDESLVAFRHSLAVLEVELGALHPRLLPTLTGLANVLDRMGSLDEALAMQMRSLELREHAFGADSTRVADALINLSMHQRSLGELDEAESTLVRAMKIYEAAYGPDHRDVAIVAINLANVLRDQGKIDAAAAQAERAQELMVKHHGPDHPSIANLLLLRAAIVCNRNRCAESFPLYRRALEIQSKALGENHPDLIYTLTNWATDHVSLKQFRRAIPLLERAIHINDMAPLDLPIVAESLFQMAQCRWGVGQHKRALELARRAHAAFERVDPRATTRTGEWLAAHGGSR